MRSDALISGDLSSLTPSAVSHMLTNLIATLKDGYKEKETVLQIFKKLVDLLNTKTRKRDASLLYPIEIDGGWDILLSAIQIHESEVNIQKEGAILVEILVESGGGQQVCTKLLEWLAKVLHQYKTEDELIAPLIGAVHGLCWKESGALTANQLNTTSLLVSTLSNIPLSRSFRALALIVRHGPSMNPSLELDATRAAQVYMLHPSSLKATEKSDDNDPDLTESACALLWELSNGDEGARRRLVEQGVLDTVWTILNDTFFDENSQLQELCWRIVRNLHPLVRPDTDAAASISYKGIGGQNIVKHIQGMQVEVLDSIRRLVRMMKTHESAQNSGLQEMHCWAVQEILKTRKADLIGAVHGEKCACISCEVVRLGLMEALVQVMDCHERCTGVQRFSFVALGFLCNRHTRNVTRLTRCVGTDLERIVRTMTVNLRCAEVQQEACTALCCMFRSCFEFKSWPDAMQSEQTLKAALQVLRFHIADAVCTGAACALLRDMASVPKHRTAFGRLDGIEIVVKAMTCHVGSVVVQREGCGILNALSWNPDNKEQIIGSTEENAGVAAIIVAMNEHREDTEVQREGCSALSILSYSSDDNKAAIQQRGGISAIVSVLLNPVHVSEEQLVERACLALWSLASMTPPPKGEDPDPKSLAMVRRLPAPRRMALFALSGDADGYAKGTVGVRWKQTGGP